MRRLRAGEDLARRLPVALGDQHVERFLDPDDGEEEVEGGEGVVDGDADHDGGGADAEAAGGRGLAVAEDGCQARAGAFEVAVGE